MRLLLKYSNRYMAKENNLPRQGSEVTFETLDDLVMFSELMGGHSLILHKLDTDEIPYWAHVFGEETRRPDQDGDFHYAVEELPVDYRSLRWLEVYNGYRE